MTVCAGGISNDTFVFGQSICIYIESETEEEGNRECAGRTKKTEQKDKPTQKQKNLKILDYKCK